MAAVPVDLYREPTRQDTHFAPIAAQLSTTLSQRPQTTPRLLKASPTPDSPDPPSELANPRACSAPTPPLPPPHLMPLSPTKEPGGPITKSRATHRLTS